MDSSSLCEASEEFSGFNEEFGLGPYQFEPELKFLKPCKIFFQKKKC